MRRTALLLALLAAAALHGCSREPERTVVHAPRSTPPAESPVAQIPAPPAPHSAAQQPGPLPEVRNLGDAEGAALLAQRSLQVPVAGIPPAALADNYEQDRGARKHEAIDIVAATGTPVVAVDDGRIVKLFTSKPGGLTIYHFDPGKQLAYYYAHLQRYADGVHEGMVVRRGDVIGYVGSTGNADPKVPHLHFAVFKLKPGANWWQGDAVNPYPALRRAAPTELVTASR